MGAKKDEDKDGNDGQLFCSLIFFSTSLRFRRRPTKLFLKRPKPTSQFSLTLSALSVCLDNLKVLQLLSSAPPSRVLALMSHDLRVCHGIFYFRVSLLSCEGIFANQISKDRSGSLVDFAIIKDGYSRTHESPSCDFHYSWSD